MVRCNQGRAHSVAALGRRFVGGRQQFCAPSPRESRSLWPVGRRQSCLRGPLGARCAGGPHFAHL